MFFCVALFCFVLFCRSFERSNDNLLVVVMDTHLFVEIEVKWMDLDSGKVVIGRIIYK
jgi:hypothetical protein